MADRTPFWRMVLCLIGLHSYRGIEIPHTYECRFCGDRTAGHN